MNRKEANQKVIDIFQNSEVRLIGMDIAKNVIPGMHNKMILHAGPPIEWARMCGPMKGAVIGALIYEGIATSEEEALKLIESGEIEFDANHEHQSVGPMAGIISPNMPVFIMKNITYGNISFANVNEGAGKCLRFGAYGEDVIKRLHWMRNVMYPVLKQAIELSGGIDFRAIATQAMQMGDDNHNRHKASTSLFMRELTKYLVMVDSPKEDVYAVAEHLEKIDMFNVNLVMAMCKSISDAAANVEGSTIVTVMARNGTEFGIKVSGSGNKWFTAPANIPTGLYFPGYSEADAAADIGDSSITETFGMGGFALAAAPAIVQFIGGTYQDGVNITNEMYEITTVENSNFKIPTLNFKGSPTGIDIVKVIETGIEPTITTGMAHKDPGIGQVGAGIVKAPMECFVKAAESFFE